MCVNGASVGLGDKRANRAMAEFQNQGFSAVFDTLIEMRPR